MSASTSATFVLVPSCGHGALPFTPSFLRTVCCSHGQWCYEWPGKAVVTYYQARDAAQGDEIRRSLSEFMSDLKATGITKVCRVPEPYRLMYVLLAPTTEHGGQ